MKERQSPSSGESERETRVGRSETERHRLRDRRHEVESERQGPSKRRGKRDFPGGLVAMTALPIQGPQVRSLVGELRSLVPPGEPPPLNRGK